MPLSHAPARTLLPTGLLSSPAGCAVLWENTVPNPLWLTQEKPLLAQLPDLRARAGGPCFPLQCCWSEWQGREHANGLSASAPVPMTITSPTVVPDLQRGGGVIPRALGSRLAANESWACLLHPPVPQGPSNAIASVRRFLIFPSLSPSTQTFLFDGVPVISPP